MVRAASSISCNWRSADGKLGFCRTPTRGTPGTRSRSRPSRFGSMRRVSKVTPVVAAGPVPALDQAHADRIAAQSEHDRNGRGGALGRERRRLAAGRRQHVHPAAHQLGRHFRQAVVLTARPAELDRNVLALDKAPLGQAAAERGDEVDGILRRTRAQEPNHRHGRLLRARRERPRSRSAE